MRLDTSAGTPPPWRVVRVVRFFIKEITIQSRRPYSREHAPSGPRINDRIRITPIRLIDENQNMVGVVELDEARRRAYELGLDLVEISPDARPPVVRIMDFGKYKYEIAKKEKASKSKTTELKEVRLGRSMKIDPHDVEIRLQQATRFLLEGHKVQIVQNFKGREIAHRSRGEDRMQEIISRLSEVAKVEVPPRMNGRRMSMIFAPDRAKVEQYKRKHTTLPPVVELPDDDDDGDDGDE
jgi:translation initiation factor IF-3